MNDPEMMAAATAAFSKMTEEQRREMQDQVARFTPEQIAQAQSMMNGMSAEQRAHMAEMAKKATPEELLQRSRQAATTPMPMPMPTSSASESESERLKAEGNALVRDKKYQEAVGKYTLALRTPGLGLETKKAAHLNASLCFLNLNRPDEAIKHASTVIKAIDASNMKAHYRRGQAYMKKQYKTKAVADLERALELCTSSDREAVEEQLEAARGMVVEVEVEVVEEDEVEIEDVEFEDVGEVSAAATQNHPRPPQMDPASMKQAAAMMEGMSDEQLEEMLKMGGAPAGTSAQQMRMATKMMSNMSAEDVQRMTAMAQKFQGGGGAANPNIADLAKDPDMVATMTKMMKDMDPVELAKMMSSSGMKVTPDQAKAMSETIQGLDEKWLRRLAAVATFFGRLVALYQRVKLYARQNPGMALAIVALIVALILRWRGLL